LHAAVAVETKRLVEPIAGKSAAVGAAVACLCFGAFAWFAWSGMETIAFCWAMVRTCRMASGFAETARSERTRKAAVSVGVFAALCPLLRPEGAVLALAGAVVLALHPTGPSAEDGPLSERVRRAIASRFSALVPLLGIALVPLLNLAMLGHARGATAMVKWAPGNPYYPTDVLLGYLEATARMLVSELLSGGPYTAIFLPEGMNYAIAAGAIACGYVAARTKLYVRAALGLTLALATLTTVTFLTILWNRVRYIWPFAPGWFFLVACLACEIELAVRRYRPNATYVASLVMGLACGALATKLPWALEDLAKSARAIDRQQVTLGERARNELPPDARIGVNDTGAIAYFSERRTFDVVGLTTEGEAPYWVAGAGSRYEHYERLDASRRPTHFIVYPEWMACSPVLGERLFEATVTDQSILGGATKVAFEASWDTLGRADQPEKRAGRTPLDVLDVSDLESETEHGYALLDGRDVDNQVATSEDAEGRLLADGGRMRRREDRFRLRVPERQGGSLVMRASAAAPTRVTVALDGSPIGQIELSADPWREHELELPASSSSQGLVTVTAEGSSRFGALHYWSYAPAD
jgi:hypothetical protein